MVTMDTKIIFIIFKKDARWFNYYWEDSLQLEVRGSLINLFGTATNVDSDQRNNRNQRNNATHARNKWQSQYERQKYLQQT